MRQVINEQLSPLLGLYHALLMSQLILARRRRGGPVSSENRRATGRAEPDNVESHFPLSLCQNSTKAANCTIYSLRLRVSPHSTDE